MPRSTWTQNTFTGGEWSPLTYGRADAPKYKTALSTCLNYVPTSQGGLIRRPGTKYIATVKNSANAVRLLPFEYSITQAYILEFGPGYIRFYTDAGSGEGQLQTTSVAAYNNAVAYVPGDLVKSGGVVYYCIANTTGNIPPNATYWYAQTTSTVPGCDSIFEVPTPYTASDIQSIQIAQSADVLYIVHPNYAPRKLSRFSSQKWTLTSISFTDGPYANTNTTTTTFTSSVAGPGAATVTASSTTGINGGTGFTSNDVGRKIRLKSGANWGYGTITAYTDSTHVTVNWVTAVGTAAATTWRLGTWFGTEGSSTTANYPSCVCFNQDRLVFAASTSYPNRIDASNTSDYENFAPTDNTGAVVDSNALGFALNDVKVNTINWIVSDEWGLLAGTASAEWVIAASTTQVALTPTNVSAKQTTHYGSTSVLPARVGKSTLFVQRTLRKVREMNYQFTLGTFQAPDISLLSEHLTKTGIKQMAVAKAPQPIVWICRNDGGLTGILYDKDMDTIAWHQHSLGGYSNAAQTAAPIVESVAVIPSQSKDRDQLWVAVKRYVNGATFRSVELLTKYWDDGDTLNGAFFVDCGAQADYSPTPTTTVSGLTWLKGQTVAVLADGSVHADCVVDSTGKITLTRSATYISVGLKYNSDGKTMRIEAGGAEGEAQGKFKRIHRAIFRFFQSVGLQVAATNGTAYPEPFRTSADLMDNPIALYTGDKRWAWDGSYELEGQVFWRQSDPLPSNILMISVQLETQDGG